MLRDGTSSRTGTAPLSINFINSSTGSITAYAWTLGDGTTSTSQNPVHVYSVAGTYTVSLEVTGPGGTNTKTLASYVKVMAPAAADVTPPGAPSSVVARASGSTTINLKWNASTDDDGVTGYRIERCQGATCATLAQISQRPPERHSATLVWRLERAAAIAFVRTTPPAD
jgi:PKD repeat protein